jgi:hypothetical protein
MEAKSEDLRPDFIVVMESLRLDVQQILKNVRANGERIEKWREMMKREFAEFKAEMLLHTSTEPAVAPPARVCQDSRSLP